MTGLASNLLLMLLPFLCALIVFFILNNADKGFDITDEAYYLISASQPSEISLSASQFGHYTGLLFSLVGKDIETFRQIGFIILLLVSFWFSVSIQSYWGQFSARPDLLSRVARHSVITTSASGYYCEWLVTPSYNWLVLVSLLLSVIALLQTARSEVTGLKRTMLYVQLGIAGALVFLAKAPSAVVLFGIALIWLGFNRKCYQIWSLGFISGATAIVMLIFHTVVFDGHLWATYNELRAATRFYAAAGGGYTTVEVFIKLFDELFTIPAVALSKAPLVYLAIPLIAWLSRTNIPYKSEWIMGFTFLALLSVWFDITSVGGWGRLGGGGGYLSLTVLGLALFFLNSAFDDHALASSSQTWKPLVAANLLLLLTAFAFAIGTNRTYMGQMSMAAVLLTAAICLNASAIDHIRKSNVMLVLVLCLCVVSQVLSLLIVSARPHRMAGSLDDQTVPVTLLGNASQLVVEPRTAKYIADLTRMASSSGWEEKGLLIDMTGGTSGATFILNAKSMPFPWLAGRTSTAPATLNLILEAADPKELEDAWVLTAPGGVFENDVALLKPFGLDFPERYVAIGETETGHRNERQVLYRPIESKRP